MGNNGTLRGERIFLQLLDRTHIPLYLQQFSESVRKAVHVDSSVQEYDYLCERLLLQKEWRTCFFCIFLSQTNQLIGAIEIRNPLEHKGQLYYWLHESFWSHGYMQESITLASNYYFGMTDAAYITVRVDTNNVRSYRSLKRAGFADIGMSLGGWGMQYELILRNKVENKKGDSDEA